MYLNLGFSKDDEQPPRTKSCLGETGDCDGTFESILGSGVCVEGKRIEGQSRGGVWKKASVQERL
jgi:hypothetical protein